MVELGVSPLVFITAVVIMGIGSACQASVGIGLALFVSPLLALLEPRFIPGPMLLAGVLLAGATAYRERGVLEARSLGISLVGLVISATSAGLLILR